MQQALVRRSDGSYLEIEIGDTYCDTYILVSDEELYSSDWDCGTGLMRAINSAFTSWVLVVGEDYDVVLYGRNAQGWALAYGGLSSMRAWLPNLIAPRSQVGRYLLVCSLKSHLLQPVCVICKIRVSCPISPLIRRCLPL